MSGPPTLSDESISDPPQVLPDRRNKFGRSIRLGLTTIGASVIVFGLFVLSPLTDRIYYALDCQDELKRADWIVCLGGDAGRAVEAARLLQEGYAPMLIVTNNGAAADRLGRQAAEWGAPADKILIEDQSTRTVDHPDLVADLANIDRTQDICIIVTSYAHMQRARRIFSDAGYKHLIMREMRWQRQSRSTDGLNWRQRLLVTPALLYEAAGWCRYWMFG